MILFRILMPGNDYLLYVLMLFFIIDESVSNGGHLVSNIKIQLNSAYDERFQCIVNCASNIIHYSYQKSSTAIYRPPPKVITTSFMLPTYSEIL